MPRHRYTALAAGQSERRGRGRGSSGAAAGRRDSLRVLRARRRRRPVHVRRLSLAGSRGRGRVDRRRFRSAEDAGDAEGRVLRIAGRPERGFAHRIKTERVMMIVQAAAGFPILLLQQQISRRGAAPGALQFQILLGDNGHFDLRLTGHSSRSINWKNLSRGSLLERLSSSFRFFKQCREILDLGCATFDFVDTLVLSSFGTVDRDV